MIGPTPSHRVPHDRSLCNSRGWFRKKWGRSGELGLELMKRRPARPPRSYFAATHPYSTYSLSTVPSSYRSTAAYPSRHSWFAPFHHDPHTAPLQ